MKENEIRYLPDGHHEVMANAEETVAAMQKIRALLNYLDLTYVDCISAVAMLAIHICIDYEVEKDCFIETVSKWWDLHKKNVEEATV